MEDIKVGGYSQTTNGAQATEPLGERAVGALQAAGGGGLLGWAGRSATAHPLRLAVVAVVVGVTLAAILPSTGFENERFGEAADLAKERLSAFGRDLWGRAKTAVQRGSEAAVAAALEEFRRAN
jgi:hypothetical protein